MTQFKGGDIGSAEDFVVGVHGAAHAVSAGIFDLEKRRELVYCSDT
jgi:hypothetical protein